VLKQNRLIHRFGCVVGAFLAGIIPPATAAGTRELIVCGWDEVYVLDLDRTPVEKVWSWRAVDANELPAPMQTQFRTTDECKAVEGGKRILITASSDGVALVDRATSRVQFYGSVGGAHSAELLPGGLIAVAGSTSKSPLANRLVLFDRNRSAEVLFDTELVSGHGVVWDAERRIVWALGLSTLRSYGLDERQLVKTAEYTLPDTSGHDLMAVPGTDLLSLTTHHHVWLFDREQKKFSLHPQLPNFENVKSISIHPETGEIAWTKADDGFWWTSVLRFLNPERTVQRPGERLYKVRWVASAGEK
jgi:hypothetical protein